MVSAAAAFVRARRDAGHFDAYPGAEPADLDAAYRCQDEAIALWDDAIAGWKVGWVPEPWSTRFGSERLVGPIFRRSLRRTADSAPVPMPVFAQGFAAVESEFVFELSRDAPADVAQWTAGTAAGYVQSMYVGIEIASSPLRNINDFGPAVVASDFGNNNGLLLGPEVQGWRTLDPAAMTCETRIDGSVIGRGSAASVSGGPLAALAFALGCCARRGRALRAGDLVTTGAATGVHAIGVGQSAEAVFEGLGTLRCRITAMVPGAPG